MAPRRTWRWLIAAALTAGAIALHARQVEADKRLMVVAQNGNFFCGDDGLGNLYVGETHGRNPGNGATECEAITNGGTAMAQCPNTTGQYRTLIRKRKLGTWQPVGADLRTTIWQAWTTAPSPISYSIPARPAAGCPGATYTVTGTTRTL